MASFQINDFTEFSAVGSAAFQSTVTPGSWATGALRTNPGAGSSGYATVLGLNSSTGAQASFSSAVAYYRFLFRYDTAIVSGTEILGGFGSANGELQLALESTGKLVVQDSFGTAHATGTSVLTSGTWYRIEVKCDLTDGANIVYEIKLATQEGASSVELSGSFTNDYATTACTQTILGKIADFNGNDVDYYYSTLLVSSSGYPGKGRSAILTPNANGTYQTATIGAGAGSHYQIVDDVPHNSFTDYLVTTGVTGDAETEALSNTTGLEIDTVNCVQAVAIVTRNAAVNGAVRVRLRSGTTDSDTASNLATINRYIVGARYYDNDPNTGSAWGTSGVDGIETGIVERSANKSRLTSTYAIVDYVPTVSAPANDIFGVTGVLSSFITR